MLQWKGFLSLPVAVCLAAGIDGLPHLFQIREKNMYKTVDKTIYKQAFSPEPLIRCWKECLDKSSFHIRRTKVEEFNKKSYWKKRGIAVVPMKFSVGFAATSYHQVKFIRGARYATLLSNTVLVQPVASGVQRMPHFPEQQPLPAYP